MIINLGNRVVNNYLIDYEDGYILIDTGYQNGFRRFKRNIKKRNINPDDIKFIFLTHAHDDHAGFLNDVLQATDAKVILHPKSLDGLRRGQNSFEGGCSSHLAHFFCLILEMLGKGEHRYPVIREKFTNRLITIYSDAFRELNFPFEIVETPGHTADHVSLIKEDVMFCGDAAMNNFPSIHRVIIWIENLQQYKQSWETIIGIHPKMIYPAHGKPFPIDDLNQNLSYLDQIRLLPLKKQK